MNNEFMHSAEHSGFRLKLWRGERMCLLGMDVAAPEPDFVGFAIEVRSPGSTAFMPLRNRLNFSYDAPIDTAVDGSATYPSTAAPFQTFRWIHFPEERARAVQERVVRRQRHSPARQVRRHRFQPADGKVFTGSSNLSPSGETGNGDNLVMIEDPKVATAYAIEAIRVFDHLHFRTTMKAAHALGGGPATVDALTLRKPTAISGKPAWFERYYVSGSELEQDRTLFSR